MTSYQPDQVISDDDSLLVDFFFCAENNENINLLLLKKYHHCFPPRGSIIDKFRWIRRSSLNTKELLRWASQRGLSSNDVFSLENEESNDDQSNIDRIKRLEDKREEGKDEEEKDEEEKDKENKDEENKDEGKNNIAREETKNLAERDVPGNVAFGHDTAISFEELPCLVQMFYSATIACPLTLNDDDLIWLLKENPQHIPAFKDDDGWYDCNKFYAYVRPLALQKPCKLLRILFHSQKDGPFNPNESFEQVPQYVVNLFTRIALVSPNERNRKYIDIMYDCEVSRREKEKKEKEATETLEVKQISDLNISVAMIDKMSRRRVQNYLRKYNLSTKGKTNTLRQLLKKTMQSLGRVAEGENGMNSLENICSPTLIKKRKQRKKSDYNCHHHVIHPDEITFTSGIAAEQEEKEEKEENEDEEETEDKEETEDEEEKEEKVEKSICIQQRLEKLNRLIKSETYKISFDVNFCKVISSDDDDDDDDDDDSRMWEYFQMRMRQIDPTSAAAVARQVKYSFVVEKDDGGTHNLTVDLIYTILSLRPVILTVMKNISNCNIHSFHSLNVSKKRWPERKTSKKLRLTKRCATLVLEMEYEFDK